MFSRVLERLAKDKDYLQNLVAACPWLEQDPVALAFLAKPENLMMLSWVVNDRPDPCSVEQAIAIAMGWVDVPDSHSIEQEIHMWKDMMQKIAKEHPGLLQAIDNMITGRIIRPCKRPRGQ